MEIEVYVNFVKLKISRNEYWKGNWKSFNNSSVTNI